MKNEEKLTFWKKIKFSITDFEKYQDLAAEKVIKTILYLFILIFCFTLIVTGIYTYKFSVTIANVRNYINENIKTINFEDNKLEIISNTRNGTYQNRK